MSVSLASPPKEGFSSENSEHVQFLLTESSGFNWVGKLCYFLSEKMRQLGLLGHKEGLRLNWTLFFGKATLTLSLKMSC